MVVQSSGENKFFLYAHLSFVEVERGDTIGDGDLIGETGVSGNGTIQPRNQCSSGGPSHLYLEVRKGADVWYEASTVDPEKHIGSEFSSEGNATYDLCSPVYKLV